MTNAKDHEKRDERWATDLGVAGAFGVWGVLLLLAPSYLDFDGPVRVVFIVLAIVAGGIAALGSLIALEKLLKHEGFGYVGSGLAFLFPAVLLFVWLRFEDPGTPWVGLVKSAVLILVALGGAMGIYGLSLFLEPNREVRDRQKSRRSRRGTLQGISATLIALTGLASAVIGLITALVQPSS